MGSYRVVACDNAVTSCDCFEAPNTKRHRRNTSAKPQNEIQDKIAAPSPEADHVAHGRGSG